MHRFCIVGMNHKCAPLEVRERIAFSREALPAALARLREMSSIRQALILSTCNRVELICYAQGDQVAHEVAEFLASFHDQDATALSRMLYVHEGIDACRHVFHVAASLDSLVVGEYQILSQLKDAYRASSAAHMTGKELNALMHRVFATAKEVRSETAIGQGQLSIASVAVSFVKRTFDDLHRRRTLLIGMGETGELVLRHLREAGVEHLTLSNRTQAHAEQLAQGMAAEVLPFARLAEALERFDVVISQTASPVCIIHPPEVERALKARNWRPMLFIDLAVPRDIHPEVSAIEGAYRYEIDDLNQVVVRSMEDRRAEVERCEAIVNRNLADFVRAFKGFAVDPMIARLQLDVAALVDREITRIRSESPELHERELESIRDAVERVLAKVLHAPISTLKHEARKEEADPRVTEIFARLFRFEDSVQEPTETGEQDADKVLPDASGVRR